jgi:2-oxoglutarate ferredoxin oxidoreductase subunit delta
MESTETKPAAGQSPKRAARSCAVYVDAAVCDGCEICVFFCKPAVFEMSRALNRRGVYPALPSHPERCTNCRLCEVGCPQLAIAVFERTTP